MKRKPNAAAIAREELVRQLARGMVRNECLPGIAARLGMTPAQARDLIFETHRAGEWSHALRAAAEEKNA